MPKSPILGGFSRTRSPSAADNQAINIALEIVETKDGKVPGYLFLTSGLDLATTIGAGPIRGELQRNDLLYVVSGQEVYSLTPNGIATLCGQISDQATPVSMFQNTKQLMIVDGVGAWLVPGGLPLTGGTIAAPTGATAGTAPGGGLYAVNDQITLLASSGSQSSFPVVEVMAVANNPVATYVLPNAGTTYTTAPGVATTPIQPQAGSGAGLTVNVTGTSGGQISTATVDVGGINYAVGDTGFVSAGSGDAVYQISAVSGGVVTGFRFLNRGTVYSVATALPTIAAAGIAPNLGTGLTFDITASSGPITASSIDNGGAGYVIGAAGLLSGGSGDATYLVQTVGPAGTVTAFSVVQPGSIDTAPTSFSQKSTTGSGSGFVLVSPTFGAFVGLIPITVPFPNPTVGDISDGFGLLVFQGLQNIAQSDELDLSTWQPLNYGVSNQSPDACVSIHVVHNEAYVFKTDNTEVWVDEGNQDFAFGPLLSVHMESGIAAPFSVGVADEEVIWLSRNDQGQGIVLAAAANGYQTRPISTQALVNEFQTYATLGDAQAYVRQEGEHVYYVLTFPTANKTWVYDKTTSALLQTPTWHQLAAFENGALNRHWGNAWYPWSNNMTVQGAQGLLGDYRTGNLYAFNPQTLTDNGAQRKWLRRWRALDKSTMNAVKYLWLAIKMQTGIGVPDGTKPQIVLRWSDDDGRSWSGERILAAGQTGETAQLIKFNRLGMTRRFKGSDRIFELSGTDPFMTAIMDAEVDAT
jgi:hypothetical protein